MDHVSEIESFVLNSGHFKLHKYRILSLVSQEQVKNFWFNFIKTAVTHSL